MKVQKQGEQQKVLQGKVQQNRWAYIDFLKGIGILMVLLVHSSLMVPEASIAQQLMIGQMGCQLFFVISGFTAMASWNRHQDGAGHFYRRRFLSIAPAYYIVILIYLLLGWGSRNVWDVLGNVFFLNGVFVRCNNNVVPGGWFIGVMMLFYLLFPVFVRGVHFISRHAAHSLLFVPVAGYMVLYAVNAGLEHFSVQVLDGMLLTGYESIIMQLPALLMGMVLYEQLEAPDGNSVKRQNVEKSGHWIFPVLTIIMGIVAVYNYIYKTIAGNVLVWSVFYYCLFLCVRRGWNAEKKHFLKEAVCRLGRVSLQIYLIHMAVYLCLVPLLRQFCMMLGMTAEGTGFYIGMFVVLLPVIYGVSRLYQRATNWIQKLLKKFLL